MGASIEAATREKGEVAPRPSRNKRQPQWLPHADRLTELVRQQPDATLQEWRDQLGVSLSVMTLCRALPVAAIDVQKKVVYAAEQDRPDVRLDAKRGKPR